MTSITSSTFRFVRSRVGRWPARVRTAAAAWAAVSAGAWTGTWAGAWVAACTLLLLAGPLAAVPASAMPVPKPSTVKVHAPDTASPVDVHAAEPVDLRAAKSKGLHAAESAESAGTYAPGTAEPYGTEPEARVVQRGGPVTLEQAIAMAQGRYRGRVVRAETKMRGGRTEHEIRILGEDGRVRNVRIDAQSGRFL